MTALTLGGLDLGTQLLPELIVSLGGMIVLLFGVFAPEGVETTRRAHLLAIVFTLIAAAAAAMLANQAPPLGAAAGPLAYDGFRWASVAVVLLGVLGTLVMAMEYNEGAALTAPEPPALVLFSAAGMLLQQSSESLGGRVAQLELGPFQARELLPTDAPAAALDPLWLRGGFPLAWLAADDATSLRWREAFIATYLERDIPALGPRIPAATLRRLWTMLAHHQGGLLNRSQLAASLAINGQTVARYIDLLCNLILVRRLPAWHGNLRKRLIRAPKSRRRRQLGRLRDRATAGRRP